MSKKKARRTQPTRQSTLAAQAAPSNEYERGAVAFARNDFDSAIRSWTGVARSKASLGVSSALAEAHFRRACKNLRKAPAQALTDLKAASQLVPDDAVYLYHLGLAYHRAGEFAKAVESYRRSLRNDPVNYQRAAFHLCLAMAESGQDPSEDSAWELLTPEQCKQLRPSSEAFQSALAALAQAKFTTAEPDLRLAHAEHRGFAHNYLGVIAWRKGQSVEALAHWLSAFNAGFDTSALRHNLEIAYGTRTIEQIQSPASLSLVRAGLKIAPESPSLLKLRQHAEFLEGNRAAHAGDWAKALEHWQSAAKSNPKQGALTSRDLLSNIALALEHLERWTEAAETWRDIARRRPRSGENAWSKEHIVQLWKHVDSLYARTGYFAKSVDVLRYAIKAQPDDPTLRLALVKRHIENQNWRGARSSALGILEVKPNLPEALYLYAQVLDQDGDLDMMIEAWEKMTGSGDARFAGLARRRLIALYPERGKFYFSVGDPESGIADYGKALVLAPDDAELHLRYGEALVGGSPALARDQFERVDLTDDDVAFAVISAWHHAGDHAEAARWLKRTTSAKKPGPALLVALGADLLASQPQLANKYFALALYQMAAAGPDSPRLLTMMAVACAENGDAEHASEYAKRALKLDPAFGPAHFNLGLWEAAQGRRQAAIKSWRLARGWAQKLHRSDIADGIDEAIELLEERYVPTLADILDTIDPGGHDLATRRLMGYLPKRDEVTDE